MSDDKFFDRIREAASALQYEPEDPATWTRLQARIRDRIENAPPSVTQMIAGWFRPLMASLAALALAVVLSVTWYEQSHEVAPPSVDSLAQNSIDVSIAGDTYSVGN